MADEALADKPSELQEALRRVVAMENKLADLEPKAAQADALTARVTELEGLLEAGKAEWETERAVYQAGITDPEAISVAKHLHARLDEKSRPPLADWLGGFKEDPSKAPKALQGYFEAPAPAEPEATGGSGGSGGSGSMGAERGSRASGGPPSGGRLSVQAAKDRLVKLSETAQRTGDWSTYDKERSMLLARISEG